VTARTELRTSAEVATWVAAGLCLRRVSSTAGPQGTGDAEEDAVIAQAILACASELGALPPAGVIADVASLLTGARLPQVTSVAAEDSLKIAIRAYEDDVLTRLVSTTRFDDVIAAFAHLGPALRPTAIALVVGALCERSSFAGLSVSPATLRRALARPRDERDATGRIELRGGAVATRLAEDYQRLARGARQSRALVDDREVFAIDHLEVLGSFGRRLAADHIGSAAEGIAGRLPRRLPANRDHRGHRDTNLADDTLYPAGGFTAITPSASASIENLVSSELVYMEDGDDVVDLFTLRYVEGELLFYTRDDSVFRRHRHTIMFALGADLEGSRVKDPDVPWQRLVLALGMLVAAIRWLSEQLGDEELTIHLAFPPKLLAPERELVELLLEGEIRAGSVIVVEQSWDAAAQVALAARGISDLVVVSLGSAPAIPKGQRALHLCLGGVAPAVYELAPRNGVAPHPDADPWTEWCEVTEELLRWLV